MEMYLRQPQYLSALSADESLDLQVASSPLRGLKTIDMSPLTSTTFTVSEEEVPEPVMSAKTVGAAAVPVCESMPNAK